MNPQQYKDIASHAATYVAGGVTVAVAFGVFSVAQGTEVTNNLQLIMNGMDNVVKGVMGLASVVVPVVTTWRATHNSSPAAQMNAVAASLSAPEVVQVANGVADPAARAKLINAVAEMPEVAKIAATPAIAAGAPSNKVVPAQPPLAPMAAI